MIITWNTDPAKGNFEANPTKFSSFYMYETASKQFVRIRLELGRNAVPGGDSGKTFANYKESRTVGFSTDVYSTSDLTKWSEDAEGRLCFNGNPLDQTPTDGARTYDCSDVTTFVHRGNPVTDSPNFPAGIESKHLSLLANDALIKKTSIDLTARNASAADLSLALKNKVSEVVGKPFAEITDADILLKLKQQTTVIKNEVVKPEEQTIENAIKDVDTLISDINEKIMSGEFTPNGEVETAFISLVENMKSTKTTVVTGDRTEVVTAFKDLQTAQKSLVESVSKLEAQQADLFKDSLQTSSKAVQDAYDASVKWDNMQTEFENIESADTIAEYEESTRGIEEVI